MFARTDALFKRIADSPVGTFHKCGLQVRPPAYSLSPSAHEACHAYTAKSECNLTITGVYRHRRSAAVPHEPRPLVGRVRVHVCMYVHSVHVCMFTMICTSKNARVLPGMWWQRSSLGGLTWTCVNLHATGKGLALLSVTTMTQHDVVEQGIRSIIT